MDDDRIERFWQSYLKTLPEDSPVRSEEYEAEGFGDSPEIADELGTLIVDGTKTATCSALWEYEAEGEPLPEVGEKFIVLDGKGDPLCIIETTEVEVRPYDEVDAQFAYEEEEGDRSLELAGGALAFLLAHFAERGQEADNGYAVGLRAISRNL